MSELKNLPSFDDVRAAADRLDGVAIRTPFLNAPQIDELAGRRVWVKAESLQRTGSFKFRGGWNRLKALSEAGGAQSVVAFSSGNHAQAVAYSAKRLGLEAAIIMPADAPSAKLAATRGYGAEVITYNRATEDREEIGRRVQAERGAVLVPPFDDPFVIAGQGTCGLEIADHLAEVEPGLAHDVLVCCAGGGLSSGIALALEERAPHLKVRTVEPEGFDDFARSLVAGKKVANERSAGSLQDALLTVMPGNLTFEIGQRSFGEGLAISDDEALQAMALAWRWLRLTLEPGGAAALAAALFRRDQIEGEAVTVVASGGNADPETLVKALKRL